MTMSKVRHRLATNKLQQVIATSRNRVTAAVSPPIIKQSEPERIYNIFCTYSQRKTQLTATAKGAR